MTTDRMLKFVDTAKRSPTKRPADERATDFGEIYDEFDAAGAGEQAVAAGACLRTVSAISEARAFFSPSCLSAWARSSLVTCTFCGCCQ